MIGRARRAGQRPAPAAPADDLLFMAWGAVRGRSEEIADALGGSSVCLYPPGSAERPHPLVRYARSTVETLRILARRRPTLVMATNPPIIPGLLALAWARLRRGRIALDSHPGAFGAKDNRVCALLLPVHRWLARRAIVSLVAARHWQHEVESWGARAMVVHEAPVRWVASPPRRHERLRVLYVGTFARDEPVEPVLQAAAELPACDLYVTGDVKACPERLRTSAPSNVHFIGFLEPPDYESQLREADVVLTLTTEPNSVMRAAYEAVYAERPLVLSDWPIARELFPHACYTGNDRDGLVAAIRQADHDYSRLARVTKDARVTQLARWERQLDELRHALGLASHERPLPRPEAARDTHKMAL